MEYEKLYEEDDENDPLFGRKRNPRSWAIVDENRKLKSTIKTGKF